MKCALDVPLVNPAFYEQKGGIFYGKCKFMSVFVCYMQKLVDAKSSSGFFKEIF